MAPTPTRTYGAASRAAPAKSKTPRSIRKRTRHVLDLHHAIPAPDPPSGDSEDGAPEPSAKRLKADRGAVPAKNGTRTTSSVKRKRRSIDREVPDSPTITRRASPSKKRKGAPDAPSESGDGGGANSSDDGEYRTIPVNTSPPPPSFKSFNSNSVKKAKRPIDYSPIDEAYELPADDEPDNFNFSGKPNGKGKAKAPVSSQYVYDESDQSSGEETSIPGTIPRSTARQGKQKVPGREPSELAETEQPAAESLDKESEADLGERAIHAVRSSQVGVSQQAEAGGSGESEYESAEEDGGKYLPDHIGPAPGAEVEEPGSAEEAAPARASKAPIDKKEKSTDESSDEESASSSEEEPADPPTPSKAPNAGVEESSGESSSSSSDSEEEPAQPSLAFKAVNVGGDESNDGIAGERAGSSDSNEGSPQPEASEANDTDAGSPTGEGSAEQSSGSDSESDEESTPKAAKAAPGNASTKKEKPAETQSTPAGTASTKKKKPAETQSTPAGNASTKKKKPTETKSTPASNKPRARQSGSKAQSPTPRNREVRDGASSHAKEGPEVQGRLTDREEKTINRVTQKFLERNELTEEDLPSLVKGESEGTEDTNEAKTHRERFWNGIYESLPKRTPRYLRAMVKRKYISYSAHKQWTTEEDKSLVAMAKKYDKMANKWKHIGPLLDRTPDECRDRHRNYALCGPARAIGTWKADDLQALLAAVSEAIPEDAELGDRPSDADCYHVDWMEVSKAMGGLRSRQQCLAKWTKMHVNVYNVRVRQLLHGRQPEVSPELRIVLMQVYTMNEDYLRSLLAAIATHVPTNNKPIRFRDLEEGHLAKGVRLETLSILWTRLRRGLGKGMRNKSDQECARRIYDNIEEHNLEEVVAEQEDVESEEAIMGEGPKSLSTKASFMVGKSD